MKNQLAIKILIVLMLFLLESCGKSIKPAELDETIAISINSKPEGAVISLRVESSGNTSDIPATNFIDVARTPYFATQSLQKLIPIITKSNLKDVTIVLQVTREGYYPITERLDPKGVLALRTIKKDYILNKIDSK